MAREKLGERMSLILDDETRREIESAMRATGEKIAANLLRKAIRLGLPLMKSGGAADVLTLDSELSKEVDELATGHNRNRNSILLEAIRKGLRAVDVSLMIEKARSEGVEEGVLKAIEAAHGMDLFPERAEARKAMLERAVFKTQVDDLVQHVSAAGERKEAIEKLIKLRTEAGQWRTVWGCGLSTSEIKWQIAMHEKYGHDSTKWPKAEIERREAEREKEQRNRTPESELPKVKPAKKKSSK